jgi:hypothetical protein
VEFDAFALLGAMRAFYPGVNMPNTLSLLVEAKLPAICVSASLTVAAEAM